MSFRLDEEAMREVWAISEIPRWFARTISWVEFVHMPLPARVRRLISHFGAVRLSERRDVDYLGTGSDLGNCIYALVWRMLLGAAPARFQVQNITNVNSCGNMIESLLAIAWFGPVQIERVMGIPRA